MTTLLTGGAGFVGANVANRLARRGERVRIFDNLSRPGVERNVEWLQAQHGANVELVVGDVRDEAAVASAVQGVDHVYHLAAQVAVTTSLVDPREDFEVNARGTLNVLEAMRRSSRAPSLIFTSTNKVYGALDDVVLREDETRWVPEHEALRQRGIAEDRPLSFHSPYGCSKGSADQYVLDYAHSFGLPAVVFRMSCIYGPRQFGTEDQGWVAHFLIRALRGQTITLYGDGKQVRDILFVEDLVDAFELVRADVRKLAGEAFNVGGGPASTTSLIELLGRIEQLGQARPRIERQPWRVADQRYYVSDTEKLRRATGWHPRVLPDRGVAMLHDWLGGQPGNAVFPRNTAAVAS